MDLAEWYQNQQRGERLEKRVDELEQMQKKLLEELGIVKQRLTKLELR